MRVGFIGLGNVGAKLAGSLLRNGVDLTIHDLDAACVADFVARGAAAGACCFARLSGAGGRRPATEAGKERAHETGRQDRRRDRRHQWDRPAGGRALSCRGRGKSRRIRLCVSITIGMPT